MNACKVECTWWKWSVDPLEIDKKYFSRIEQALEYCNTNLLHHKDWRIIQNGRVVRTLGDEIIGRRWKYES